MRDRFTSIPGRQCAARCPPRDIVTVDLNGALLEGAAKPPLEFHIHSEIYRARPDVHAVVHAHPRWSTLLTMVGAPFKTVYAQAALIGEVRVMESPLSINTKAMGEQVAATLGGNRAVLLRSHGAVIVGGDIVECFALATYLEENARRQYLAMQIGDPYVFSDAEQQACRANLWSACAVSKELGLLSFETRNSVRSVWSVLVGNYAD